MNSLLPIALLVGGTVVSEDLTCITAGQLVARERMSLVIATGACFTGIYFGDLLLWLVGRVLGRRALRLRWVSRRVNDQKIEKLRDWFDRNALQAIVAARFMPGTRLPLYVAAGTLGRSAGKFALGTFLAALLWTPAVVLGVAALGDGFVRAFEAWLGTGWIAVLAGVILIFICFKLILALTTDIGRAKLIARVSLLWRWEFWPMIVFYPPVALWVAWLSLRHRGFATITAANPGIPHGGFVGESKFQILSKLKSKHVIPTALIHPSNPERRLAQLDAIMRQQPLSYPLILKPDVGQRGAGVKLIASREAASQYLTQTRDLPVIAQPYHPGPHEAGIFYYRFPGKPGGRIFSITDKHFSRLVGDGTSTVEQLIWRHLRYRMQAATFLKRHAGHVNRVLARGETFTLAVAGNHCQGTLFRDGAHLITPQLEQAIDRIARSFDGFHFGRFDVRYGDVEAFKRGKDLTVIELNGITSESTNIYDPSRSLIWAYRMLFAQWSILFRIGAMNRSLGHRASTCWQLFRDTVRYYVTRQAPALSD